MILERLAHGFRERHQRLVQAVSKAEGHRELVRRTQIELPQERDIAVGRGIEFPIHAKIMSQVLPTVGRADIATRGLGERDRRLQRQPDTVLVGREHLSVRRHGDVAVIVPASHIQVRRQQNIQLQLAENLGGRLETSPDEQARPMRVANDLADERISSLGTMRRHPIAERMRGDALDLVMGMTAAVVKEGFAVSHQNLHVANLRSVDRRKRDLVDRPARQGEPHAAEVRISRAHAVFVVRAQRGGMPGPPVAGFSFNSSATRIHLLKVPSASREVRQ